jgi:uncharacterized membrane protein YhaH (DUF805 family)
VEQNQPAFWLALKDGLNRYADFSGVSTRSQYWYFILTTNIAAIIGQLSFGDLAGNIIAFGTLIPTLAVAVRRVHDVGKSGWFILIPIYNIILFVTPSAPREFNL